MSRICFWLLLVSCAAGEDRFHIAGTVINGKTGEPVRGAIVSLVSFQPPAPPLFLSALTDLQGRFQVDNLSAGTYRVGGEKNNFAADTPQDNGSVTIGPSRDGLTLRLNPLAVITGRVIDSDGDPVPFANVRALERRLDDGTYTYRQMRSVTTDDQGRYRVWNLSPGDYYIVTAGRSGSTQSVATALTTGSGGPDAFAPVYYPAARDRAAATPISVTWGQEFTADLKVRMEPSYRIRGTLLGVTLNQPIQVELLREGGDTGTTRATVNTATGRFEVREAVPGNYLLRAVQTAGGQSIRGEIPVQVNGRDISGLMVQVVPGVRVTGVVDLPASPAAPTQKLQRGVLRGSVQLTPVDPSRGMQAFASIDEQGRFAIESVLPGLYRLKVITALGYVASAVSGTQDLLHGDLEIASGTPPPELEIRVRADAANLTARAPQESGWMLLTRPGGEYIEFTQSFRSAGHFVRIAPGDYVVYFIPKIETLEYRNPAIIHALRGGVSVTLAPGADQTIDIQEVAR